MGPPENPTRHREKQEARAAETAGPSAADPAVLAQGMRAALSPANTHDSAIAASECREAAREWSEWKARRKYRATAAGKQKRNGQSQRYRKRVKERKPPEKEAVPEAARVITKNFFRWLLRPAWLL